MKKLLAILISLCMVSAFAVPVFADANSDYIAAVKAYQLRSPRRKLPTLQRWMHYSKNAKAKADADSAAILKPPRLPSEGRCRLSGRHRCGQGCSVPG